MQQVFTLNPYIPYVGGLCEGYVEGTADQATLPYLNKQGKYTTDGVYSSAIAAWNNSKGNHPNEQPPKGVMVAVYFTLKNNLNGHTAISLGDGQVASSTQAGYHSGPFIHKSLQDLIDVYTKAQGGCTYLGWKEYIGNQQIVKEGEDMKVTAESCYNAFNGVLMRPPTKEDIAKYVDNWNLDSLLTLLMSVSERSGVVEQWGLGKQAQKDDWAGQIGSLKQATTTKTSLATELKPGNYIVK